MRKLLAVAACAVGIWGFVACGGGDSSGGTASDPVEGCKQIQEIMCDKVFKCYTKEQLDASKDKVGLNAADCVIKFSVECTAEKQNCNSGDVFHADKLQACIDGFKTFTCSDVMNPAIEPAACAQICTK
jgi:hypothetical protein